MALNGVSGAEVMTSTVQKLAVLTTAEASSNLDAGKDKMLMEEMLKVLPDSNAPSYSNYSPEGAVKYGGNASHTQEHFA